MPKSDRSVLASYILQRMRERGLEHQADLARAAGISVGGLSHILTTNGVLPKPETIEKIARALEVEPVELTSRAGYTVDNIQQPNAMAMRLARAIEARPWMAERKDLLLSLSEAEFAELMDLIEFRRNRRQGKKKKDRPNQG